MNLTSIEWVATMLPDGTTRPGFTTNPLKYRDKATGKVVWACVKHSPGCNHCYSETLANRYGRGGPFKAETMRHLEPFLDEKELRHILTAKTVGGVTVSGSRCFPFDMTDVFGDWVSDEMLDRLFAVMAIRRDVLFMVLTKRPERMAAYMESRSKAARFWKDAAQTVGYSLEFEGLSLVSYPLPNVMLGFSAENQEWFDRRSVQAALLRPAGWKTFVSAEPLIGPLTLPTTNAHACGSRAQIRAHRAGGRVARAIELDLVIVGGESGAGARPFHLDWARSIQDQCDAAGVPLFMKQAGSNPHDWTRGDPPNHEPPELVPLKLRDRKGGDLSELPTCLRVRDFPTPPRTA